MSSERFSSKGNVGGIVENCECKFRNNNVFRFKVFPSVHLLLHCASEKIEGGTKTERNHDKVIKQLKVKAVVVQEKGSRVNEGIVFDCAVVGMLFK